MRLYSKEELIEEIRRVFASGWHRSVRTTIDTRNDGAVGNTLEALLGINENNLPIPNTGEWELKGQRKNTSSLVTLKHIEPSPTAAKIVSNILLPYYGWKHKQAGIKYSETEMSFRSTTSAIEFTNRGFKILVDRNSRKIRFIFNADKTDRSDNNIKNWLLSVQDRIGLGPISPEPYWGFDDLNFAIGSKITNCFYVVANTKIENGQEFFKYEKLLILSGFSFEMFLGCIENGFVFIDFDARSGHNHGTKFRLKQDRWANLYSSVIETT